MDDEKDFGAMIEASKAQADDCEKRLREMTAMVEAREAQKQARKLREQRGGAL